MHPLEVWYYHPYTRFRQEVERRGAALRLLSTTELLALANTPTETLRFAWKTATISLIIEERQPGIVRVIVQGFLRFPSWSPASSYALDAFYKSADGRLTDVPQDELWEFS